MSRASISLEQISKSIKKSIIILWMIMLIGFLGYYFYNPSFFSVDSLRGFLERFGGALLIVYFLLSALRGFTLIPSLPFVLVGVLLFPQDLYFVYAISMVGILLSATMVYFFSREMGFEDILKRHHPRAIERSEKWVEKYGFYAITLWSFIIVVPTDVICYIAGILRMNYWKFITAVAIGEGVICIFLIFSNSLWFQIPYIS